MPAAGHGVGIGAVLDALVGEFPDVTISKIRYLEAQGLITPERTAKGSRRYRPADIDRLRFVLSAQRDRFWPLKVIREHLDAIDRGLVPSGETFEGRAEMAPPTPTHRTSAATLESRPPLRLTAAELQRSSGIDGETLRDLLSFGLVHADGEHFGADDLDVATAAGRLVAAGIEVRHLRPFRTAAEREVGLVEHVRARGRAGGRGQRAESRPEAADVAAACLDLHTALVRAQLSRTDG